MADTGAQIQIGANTTEYNRVVGEMPKTMEKSIGRIQGTMDKLDKAFGLAMAGAGLRSMYKSFGDIQSAASKLGMSAEDVQRINNSAELLGSSFETVDSAIRAVTVNIQKLSDQGGEALGKLKDLGIDPEAFLKASEVDRIKMMADAQERATNSAGGMAEFWAQIGKSAGNIDWTAISSAMSGGAPVVSNQNVAQMAGVDTVLTQSLQSIKWLAGTVLGTMIDGSEAIQQKFFGAGMAGVFSKLFDANGRFTIDKNGNVSDPKAFLIKTPESGASKPKTAKEIASDKKAEMDAISKQNEDLELQYRKAALEGNDAKVQSLKDQIDFNKKLIKYEGDRAKALEDNRITIAEREAEADKESEKAKLEADKVRDSRVDKARGLADRWREMRGKYIPGPTITPADYMADIGTRSGFDGPDQIYRSGAAANMRISGRYQRMMDRAAEYEGRGAYNSAAGLQDRAAQYLERENRKAMDRLDKQVDNARKSLGESGISAEEKDKRKTRYEELQKKHDAASGGGGGAQSVEMTAADILKEVRNRLPIAVMGTN